MKKIYFILVFSILILGGFFAWWLNGIAPVNKNDTEKKLFIVDDGDGVRVIASNLKSKGLIKDPVIFFLTVKQLGLDQKIQAGNFLLSPSLNAIDIAKALQIGTSDNVITVPEGKRAEEIAEILEENFSNYEPAWRSNLILQEGYLFPDTYSISKNASIEQIISLMRDNFEKKYQEISISKNNNLSKEDVVILASMIEREAKHDKDRPLVASVMVNRLNAGMPLQIDATIQYALGYQNNTKTWWKKNITFADLEIVSDYNTYTNNGLPPKPISNPGLKALKAVVNPANTDFLFYISDKNGENHYAKTFAEHNANIKKFGL